MAQLVITEDQRCVVHAQYKTASGVIRQPSAQPVWASSDLSVAELAINDMSGLNFTVIAHNTGVATVTVTAQHDDPSLPPVVLTFSVVVNSGDIASGELAFDSPVHK